jgi:hypothetical protein
MMRTVWQLFRLGTGYAGIRGEVNLDPQYRRTMFYPLGTGNEGKRVGLFGPTVQKNYVLPLGTGYAGKGGGLSGPT